MKKMFTLFLGAALALSVSAQDVALIVKKFQTPPTIGGGPDAQWALASKQIMDAPGVPEGFGPPTITEAYFKMGWVDSGLFVLVYRNDDAFANQFISTIDDWKSDRDELFFDVFSDTLNDGRGAINPNGASYGHYQFTSLWQELNQTDTAFRSTSQWYHNRPFFCGYKFLGANIYNYEYFIPFKSLSINPTFIPSVGTDTCPLLAGDGSIFGFSLSINDYDPADNPTSANEDTYRRYLRWELSASLDPWNNMNDAPILQLSDSLLTSVKENTLSSVNVYPNPAANSIMTNIDGDVAIYNVTGQLVLEQKAVKAGQEVNISNLKNGTYFVKIGNETTKVSVIR